MSVLVYLVYYLIFYPLSLLPMGILYLISDAISFLLFRVFAYRKKVIYTNLKNSFPAKTDAELKVIQRKFSRHFTDVFIAEMIKSFSATDKFLRKRIKLADVSLLEKLKAEGRSVIMYSGHYGNWEQFSFVAKLLKPIYPLKGAYKVQTNKVANRILYNIRIRFGLELSPSEQVRQSFLADVDRPNIFILIGDQSPAQPQHAYWTTFLNQETGVITGTEKMAKIYDYSVVFFHFERVKRGHYLGHIELLTNSPKTTEKGEISELHTRALERVIQENPPYWLWSHRRWKHRKPDAK